MSRRRGAAHVYDVNAYNERDDKISYSEPSHSSANIINVKKDEAPGTYPKVIFIIFLALAALTTVISAKAEATAIKAEINEQQKKVDTLKSENTRMQAEIESKTSRGAVESYAENILGMQKIDKSQCEYISLESGNIIEIPEDEDNFFVKLYNDISDLFEYLKG